LVGALFTHFNHKAIKYIKPRNKNWNFKFEALWLLFNTLVLCVLGAWLNHIFIRLYNLEYSADKVAVVLLATLSYFLVLYLFKNIQVIIETINTAYELNNNLIKYHKILGKEASNAQQDQHITIPSDSDKEKLNVNIDELLYISASSNYIEVFWEENGEFKKKLLRNTLKKVQNLFTGYDEFFRCHRSTLVNLKKIETITGNSQGYKLKFPNEAYINVSRTKSKELKELLEEYA
jgi:DNA-binding LytR/AlgR family response regulator